MFKINYATSRESISTREASEVLGIFLKGYSLMKIRGLKAALNANNRYKYKVCNKLSVSHTMRTKYMNPIISPQKLL